MMVILYRVISFGKNEIMCVWKMYILCVYALCVTLQELTSICNCESDVTDGFFEWFIDSKESNWWVGNRMLVSNFALAVGSVY